MKKLLLITVCLGVLVANAQTPVTLNESNMPFGPGTYKPVSANLTGVPVPVAGTNAVWDYDTMQAVQTYNYQYIAPPTSTFPQATYADTGLAVSFIQSTVYYTDYYYEENANRVAIIGSVTPYQRYNIGSMTGGAQDSCIFPSQNFLFTSPAKIIKYPATMSSAWQSSYTDKVNFQLSIAAYGLNHTPCQRVSHVNRLDTVIGWGKVTVPTATGPSQAYDALMVKRQSVVSDSFYLNGLPAPPALLTPFGLSQGQTTTTNRYLFWRPNSVYPILLFNFGANNFTTPTSIFYDGNAQPSGIADANANDELNIFPNPSNDFILVAGAENCKMEMTDIAGKVLFEKEKIGAKEKVNIAEYTKGTYFIKITNEKSTIVRKVIVL